MSSDQLSEHDASSALPTPPSRVDQVYDAIIDDICTGRLAPGTPLRQEVLASRFNVSRQPVQQALLLLRNHGLVREHGRSGVEVVPLDRSTVCDLYELRALFDGYAAGLMADQHTAQSIGRLRNIMAAGLRALEHRSFAQMISEDVSFHRLIVDASNNPLLTESANVMWRNVERVMGEVLLRSGTPEWVWTEHAQILDAIEAGDRDRAEMLARQHAENGRSLILEGMGEPLDDL